MMSYEPFWKTLKEKNVTTYKLIYKCGISSRTLANMKKGKPIETTTIEKFCKILNCNVENIVTYVPDDE